MKSPRVAVSNHFKKQRLIRELSPSMPARRFRGVAVTTVSTTDPFETRERTVRRVIWTGDTRPSAADLALTAAGSGVTSYDAVRQTRSTTAVSEVQAQVKPFWAPRLGRLTFYQTIDTGSIETLPVQDPNPPVRELVAEFQPIPMGAVAIDAASQVTEVA